MQCQLQSLQTSAAAAAAEQGTTDELQQHVAQLKREFAELLAELQRRRSPVGGASSVTCEVGPRWRLLAGGKTESPGRSSCEETRNRKRLSVR